MLDRLLHPSCKLHRFYRFCPLLLVFVAFPKSIITESNRVSYTGFAVFRRHDYRDQFRIAHFINCNGLDAEGHLTTAKDIALMSRELITAPPHLPYLHPSPRHLPPLGRLPRED